MPTLNNLAVLVPVLLVGWVANPVRVAPPPPVAGESPGLGDPHDWKTGVYAAARNGDAARVRQFLTAHPELLDAEERYTKRPRTLLQIAADENRLAVMRLLIDRGADVEAGADSREGSPLRIAAREGHREAAELLLANGATLDLYSAVALDRRGEVERTLRIAAAFGAGAWAANLRCPVFSTDVPTIRAAADKGHAELVRLLVRYGADPDAEVVDRPSYISDNNFKGVTVGLTPAGTFAPDLDVPARGP